MKPRAFAAATACSAGFVLLTSQQLPPVVASHFDSSGAADGFMPVRTYVGLMLLLLVGLPALVVSLSYWALGSAKARINLPDKAYWLAPERREQTVRRLRSGLLWFGTLLLAFLCYSHWLVVLANGRQPQALPGSWFVGGLVVFLGLVLVWLKVLLSGFRRNA